MHPRFRTLLLLTLCVFTAPLSAADNWVVNGDFAAASGSGFSVWVA